MERLGTLDPQVIAQADPQEFADLCARPPGIHRYARSMAGRIQKLAAAVVAGYGGEAERLWSTAATPGDLLGRLEALPGFGPTKARIFAALLGKQLGVRPPGWREAIGPYAEEGSLRSVADVVDRASLDRVRAAKRERKASGK